MNWFRFGLEEERSKVPPPQTPRNRKTPDDPELKDYRERKLMREAEYTHADERRENDLQVPPRRGWWGW